MQVLTKVTIQMIVALLIFSAGEATAIVCGASQVPELTRCIGSRKTAVLSNPTAMVGGVHLVDTLLHSGVHLIKLFAPEHGFRGTVEAGAKVDSGIDPITGLPVISLYGDHKKPTTDDLKDIEVVVFDIQDVGARFFTYISTLTLMMEACAENNVDIIVCDRPNPNGGKVDGPSLEPGFSSFVGMHRIPVMHGMTIGEYALMVNGERWLKNQVKASLHILPCQEYTHDSLYHVPVRPSPNLRSDVAILAYPTLCFFEGTDIVSIGRGTDRPFERMGNPGWDSTLCNDRFTPRPAPGASLKPMHEGRRCYGFDLSKDSLLARGGVHPEWLILAWEMSGKPETFFNTFFSRLAGTKKLESAILAGKTASEIRASWQQDILAFQKVRSRYLLYP
jgi:uncharacterized protein YbbC (DUF1343 family)